MRSIILWLLGVPISVIILIALFYPLGGSDCVGRRHRVTSFRELPRKGSCGAILHRPPLEVVRQGQPNCAIALPGNGGDYKKIGQRGIAGR